MKLSNILQGGTTTGLFTIVKLMHFLWPLIILTSCEIFRAPSISQPASDAPISHEGWQTLNDSCKFFLFDDRHTKAIRMAEGLPGWYDLKGNYALQIKPSYQFQLYRSIQKPWHHVKLVELVKGKWSFDYCDLVLETEEGIYKKSTYEVIIYHSNIFLVEVEKREEFLSLVNKHIAEEKLDEKLISFMNLEMTFFNQGILESEDIKIE